jgi:dynein heavy chain
MPVCLCCTRCTVDASVAMYRRVELELLPTPAKSHYTFNLRDLSKVFQGVMMAAVPTINSREDLVSVWLHEQARVFRDRLIDETDRVWFNNLCSEMLRTRLST